MVNYKLKFRRQTTRLKSWDYSCNASYFITIVTKNRVHHFGKIIDHKMNLSKIGEMAEKYWFEIPNHFPFVQLDAFVVMPDHVHGIITIDKKYSPSANTSMKNKFGPQSKNLASIIRGYKIGVTKNAKKINPLWKWQPRYHDHIIRDKIAHERIKNYIINNPKNWRRGNDD